MRRGLSLLAIAVLLATAGCNSLFSSPTPTETLTPAPSVSPAPAYPPGLGPDGVTDGFAVASGHATSLEGANYTVLETRSVRFANGTALVNRTERTRVAARSGRYHHRLVASGTGVPQFPWGSAGTMVMFSNGTLVALRLTAPSGDSQHRVFRNPDGSPVSPETLPHGTPTNRDRIAVLLARSRFAVAPGDGRFDLRATGFAGDSLAVGTVTVRDLSVTAFSATVGPDGFVRAYDLRFEGTVGGEPVSGHEVVRYGAVGRTEVTAPAWFAAVAGDRTASPPP